MAGGLRKPKHTILGSDIAGQVESVGRNVKAFKVGDAVYGDLSGAGQGGFAEYVAAPEHLLAKKPAGLTFEEAAAVPMAAVTALQGLRDAAKLQAGQKVVIYGASGGVGTFAVQLAKVFGAEVTAVCSTRKVEMVRSLGADHVIDYTREDFTKNGQRYDLVVAVNGYRSIFDYLRALVRGGRHTVLGGSMAQIFQAMLLGPLISMVGSKKVAGLTAKPNGQDLALVGELLDDRKVMPVMDRCYPMNETAEALRYVGDGHAVGKVVISVPA
jgi:NADPH:quinone reductase-like Zn-dependent oxidoreductase